MIIPLGIQHRIDARYTDGRRREAVEQKVKRYLAVAEDLYTDEVTTAVHAAINELLAGSGSDCPLPAEAALTKLLKTFIE